ncbi:MAG TPA: aspartate aminotransferase family protein [Pseudonocardiaceae bacterium]|nr:aspartate aminotransferase family protein [Pseudonocardiaceae bacterium]
MTTPLGTPRADAARDHLWLHFTRHGLFADGSQVPIIVRGDGCRVYDDAGKPYLDGISGLFVVQVGHGRRELVEIATRQAAELAYFPLWSYAHPAAIDLAERLAHHAPGDLNRVFFTLGGGDAVDSALKLAKQYHKLAGNPGKHKMVSRMTAYHGTPQGTLAVTGVPYMRTPFEPLAPGAFKVPNTNAYRAPDNLEGKTFGRWAADRVEEVILAEGPETVAAVVVEPVQTGGGCFPPPPGYFERLREICDTHDVLLVSDEVICAFGRIGSMFACDDFGYVPDIITCAKALSSGYAPIGAMIASDRVFEPFRTGDEAFLHGYTFGGHPVSAAVASANLDIIERERLGDRVRAHSPELRAALERLLDLPIVGDVRGEGYLFAVELVKDKATKQTLDAADRQRLVRGFLPRALWEAGLYCRIDERGEPAIQVAPPLIAGPAEFAEIEQILRGVLAEASALL